MIEKAKQEALTKLRELRGDGPETAHQKADGILCDLLIDLGCSDVVDEYMNVERWFS